MAAMTKIVNIKAPVAIRNVNPPICGNHENVIMSTGDILKCICKRAIVDEILPDGSTVRLTMRNYYTDNGAGLDAMKNIKSVVAKTTSAVETTKVEEAVEETKIEEPKIKTVDEEITNPDVAEDAVTDTDKFEATSGYVSDEASVDGDYETSTTTVINSEDTITAEETPIETEIAVDDTDKVETTVTDTTEEKPAAKKTTQTKTTSNTKKKSTSNSSSKKKTTSK